MMINEGVRENLLGGFWVEAKDHVQTITDGLLALEQQSMSEEEKQAVLDKVFRAAHSLKGAARAVNVSLVTQMAHALEDVLGLMRQGEIELTPELFTACYQTLDIIRVIQGAYESGGELPSSSAQVLTVLEPFLERGRSAEFTETARDGGPLNEPAEPHSPEDAAPKPPKEDLTSRLPEALRRSRDETIRVNVTKLDALMAQLSELLTAKIRAEQRLNQLYELEERLSTVQKDWASIRGGYYNLLRHRDEISGVTRHGKQLVRVLDYVDESQDHLHQVETLLGELVEAYANDTMHMALTIDELEEEVKRVRMLPLSTIMHSFGRMVRDLAYEDGKEATLRIEGAETELDKHVLEKIKDPLIHLLRNAVDHGIEPPEERVEAGKPRHGTIQLSAEQVGKDVVISISDDGAGLDLDAIREVVAQRRGEDGEALTDADLTHAIYEVGVSTSPIITDVSGRGVGLDVVRRNVESLRGRIDMTWSPGEGTTFTLTLPLALSSSRGLLVRVAQRRFAIPLNAIERLMSFEEQTLTTLGQHEAIVYNDQPVRLVHLADVLNLPRAQRREDNLEASIIVLAAAERRMAFVVAGLLGEQEIVTKGLGKQLSRVRGVTGATVMGNGEITLVLNVGDLMDMAQNARQQAVVTKAKPDDASNVMPSARKRLLVVDDSITTRTLEKNILEAAGYTVVLATNGQEAWNLIATGDVPDLVVSDVVMPQMDGIALTTRIKRDARVGQMPVILVTSLDSPQDKARGVEAGADAYITKGAFDQNILLRTVQQLI